MSFVRTEIPVVTTPTVPGRPGEPELVGLLESGLLTSLVDAGIAAGANAIVGLTFVAYADRNTITIYHGTAVRYPDADDLAEQAVERGGHPETGPLSRPSGLAA
jgi:hypothetical protein